MPKNDRLEMVASLFEDLESWGLEPVLVGGMALILMGSQRVTKDFDFLISFQESTIERIVETFYKYGFELISKFTATREVQRTIDKAKVAAARLKLDTPDSCYFFNPKIRLKIDLLFDFPIPAKEVRSRSLKISVKSHSIRIASLQDLIRMKEISYADRRSASDAHDLEFLRKINKSG